MTTYRAATESDRPGIEQYLEARLHLAMFPRSNLARHGMTGDHPHATRFWVSRLGADVCGLVARANNGIVMPVQAPGDDAAAATALRHLRVTGVVGPKSLSRGLIAASGMLNSSTTVDQDLPHYHLHLSAIIVPPGVGQLVPVATAPRDTVRGWFVAFQAETLGDNPDTARARGHDAYALSCADKSAVVLMDGDTPLAMTGVNAQLPQIVQVGGVYCPPGQRNRGHARRALALHLVRLRDQGVQEAVLFSANPAASRAYESLGFRCIGDWTVVMFKGTVTINGKLDPPPGP